MNNADIKQALFNKCKSLVEERIRSIQEAITASREAANSETKSSAGDKHETGRAMMQLEQEKLQAQHADIDMQANLLAKLNLNPSSKIIHGSLVYTNIGNFFISISAGKAEVNGKTYFFISPSAPIASAFLGAKVKDKIIFNGKEILIEAID